MFFCKYVAFIYLFIFFNRRPWYKRTSSAPERTSISTPYMDAAGVGKIVTISQAVFEGMTPRESEECDKLVGAKPGGCKCNLDEDCISRKCRNYFFCTNTHTK